MSSIPAKATVAIPARLGSTRLPGKVLLDLGGKPVVQHVWERVRSMKSAGRVVILADTEQVRAAAEAFGAEVIMTSPECRSGTERLSSVLAQLPGPRVLIAGDMAETGENAARFHEEVCAYAKEQGVDRLLAVGEHMREAVGAFGSGARWFASIEELVHASKVAAQTPGSMLVKASRAMHLEEVVDSVTAAMTAQMAAIRSPSSRAPRE